ncbi:hypothetical protein FRB93_012645 [Tulasnella sp. JGI-2019a]|nr:hypothetical protein FRB93_012645 [Tulasnella sp. JGI-2019a]
MSLVYANDPAITYSCPSGALQATWSLRGDGQGGYTMDTRGNGCFMQYSFTGTGISVQIIRNWDHGWFSCALDNNTPQWFNANSGTVGWGMACTLTGACNDKHTIKITNSDEPGWALSVNNITLSASPAQNVTTFTSDFPPVQVPVSLTSSQSGSLYTARGSKNNTVSTSTLGVVSGVLGLLILVALGAAAVFWRRDCRSRQQLRWKVDLSEGTPFTMNVSTALESQSGSSAHLQDPLMVSDTMGSSSARVEPSPAYTPHPTQKRG